ncbi:MAG: HAMP domain-containing protein, partial [Candidatus Omnitrophica bacterium]|nr:HAMP domain-containing protein [Candidatus Omnitrophota bacterium]
FSAIFVGFFMIKMALDPVKKISKAMSRISTKNLQERIDVSGGDQEIKLLANTFNDMLGRLERSFTIQKQFIQDISHELKTPLTAMRGKQEVSLLKKRSAEDYESVLQVNLDEIEKMSHLVEDLLVLVSMDNKDSFFKMEDIDLGAIIKRAVDNMRALVQQKQITLTTSLQNQIFIKADKIQISRLLVILLDNAIKYTSSKGRIEIKLYQQGAEAKMAVSNTGAGIDKNDLPHIFERFYRADKSRNSSGFGLGLSIAKTIIDAHQGSIEATSQLGQVTVFTVSLPFAPLSKIN